MTSPKADRRGTAARIRTAARALFLERGYGATSMDAVAAAAPVSKRTLYQYYPGKAELFGAVIAEVWGRFTDAPPLPDPSAAAPRAVLTAYVERLRAHWDQPEVIPFLRLIIAEAPRFPELAPAYVQAGKQQVTESLGAYFEALARTGHLRRPGHPGLAAAQFLGMVKETLFWPRVFGGGASFAVTDVVEAALDMILLPEEGAPTG